MSKQVAIVVVAAFVLFGVALVGALAFTGSSNNGGGTSHTMPDGQTMTTPMHTMDNGDTMTGMTMP